jgi:hypothetical protein
MGHMVTKNPALILAADLLLAHAPQPDDEAVGWYRLILEMEGFSYRTGWALGAVWDLVHSNNYLDARVTFDEVAADPQYARPALHLVSEVRALRWVPSPRAQSEPDVAAFVCMHGDGPPSREE